MKKMLQHALSYEELLHWRGAHPYFEYRVPPPFCSKLDLSLPENEGFEKHHERFYDLTRSGVYIRLREGRTLPRDSQTVHGRIALRDYLRLVTKTMHEQEMHPGYAYGCFQETHCMDEVMDFHQHLADLLKNLNATSKMNWHGFVSDQWELNPLRRETGAYQLNQHSVTLYCRVLRSKAVDTLEGVEL